MRKRIMAAVLMVSMVFNSSGFTSAYAAELGNPPIVQNVEDETTTDPVSVENIISEQITEGEIVTDLEATVADNTENATEAILSEEYIGETESADESVTDSEEEFLFDVEEEYVSEGAVFNAYDPALEGFCGSDEDKENLTWTIESVATGDEAANEEIVLTISGEGDMSEEYEDAIDFPWHEYRNDITKIVVDEGVTAISAYAFYSCMHVVSVELPDSLEVIGANAFKGCVSLEEITIPSGIKNLEASTFEKCRALKTVNLGDGLEYINKNAFKDCVALTGVNFGEALTDIGASAFAGCLALESIELPDSVETIGANAFENCSALKNITLSSSLKEIGKYAFKGTAITEISLPDSLKNINSYALANMELTSIHFGNGITSVASGAFDKSDKIKEVSVDSLDTWLNISFSTEDANPVSVAHSLTIDGEELEELVILKEVTTIKSYAFTRCKSLKSIVFNDELEEIGKEAFYGCGIENPIYLGNSIDYIGDGAFGGNASIRLFCEADVAPKGWNLYWDRYLDDKQVNYGYNYDEFEYWVVNTPNEENLVVSEDVRFIPYFGISKDTKSITIPENIKYIESGAFSNTKELKAVYADSIEQWCQISFEGYDANPLSNDATLYIGEDKEAVSELVIPDEVTEIGKYSFCGTDSIKSVYLHDDIVKIGIGAFKNCNSLDSVFVPAQAIGNIGSDAFYNENSLVIYTDYNGNLTNASWNNRLYNTVPVHSRFSRDDYELWKEMDPSLSIITIPEDATAIPDGMFEGFSKLEYITIPEKITEIGDYAFSKCSSLQEITIPDSVEEIGQYAFSECSSLKKAVVNAAVTNMSDGVFKDCIMLSAVTLPESLEDIGIMAFENCANLNNVVLPENITNIKSNAFYNCNALENITLNDNLEVIGTMAFGSCTSLGKLELGDAVTTICESAFANCTGLESVKAGEALVDIGDSAFAECSVLSALVLNDGLESIGKEAFTATAITELVLPDSVDTIGVGAFNSCEDLTSVSLPDSLAAIPNACFAGCIELNSVEFGEQNATIGEDVFSSCTSIKNIEIAPSIQSIGARAFDNCSGLEKVTFGKDAELTTIDEYAFRGCNYLADITIPDGVETINKGAFINCGELLHIYLPDSVENLTAATVLESPFYGVDSKTVIYCGAEKKPEGWGEFWNYCSDSQKLEVVYGFTREEYIEDIGYISRDDEDYMLRGKINLGELWSTNDRSIVITEDGYYIGDPHDSVNVVKKVEGTEPIKFTGNVKDSHGNSIIFVGDDIERTLVFDDFSFNNLSNEISPFIKGNGKIELIVNGEVVITNSSKSIKDEMGYSDVFMRFDTLTISGAGNLSINSNLESYEYLMAGSNLYTKDFTGNINVCTSEVLLGEFEKAVLHTTGDIKFTMLGLSNSLFRSSSSSYNYSGYDGIYRCLDLEANNITLEHADTGEYGSGGLASLCYVYGLTKIKANDKLTMKGTGIFAYSIDVEAGEGGIDIDLSTGLEADSQYFSNYGNIFYSIYRGHDIDLSQYISADVDMDGETITRSPMIRIVSGGDFIAHGGMNQPRASQLICGSAVIDVAGDMIMDSPSQWILTSTSENPQDNCVDINVEGDLFVAKSLKGVDKTSYMGHYVGFAAGFNDVRINVGGGLEFYTLMNGNPIFTCSSLRINAGKNILFDTNKAFLLNGGRFSLEAQDDIVFNEMVTVAYSASQNEIVSHNGGISFHGSRGFGTYPLFGGSTKISAKNDIVLDTLAMPFYGGDCQVTSSTGGLLLANIGSPTLNGGSLVVDVAKDMKAYGENVAFSGDLHINASNIDIQAQKGNMPMFLSGEAVLEADGDVDVSTGFMLSVNRKLDIEAAGTITLDAVCNGPALQSTTLSLDAGKDISIVNGYTSDQSTNGMLIQTSSDGVSSLKAGGNISLSGTCDMSPLIMGGSEVEFMSGNKVSIENKSSLGADAMSIVVPLNLTAREFTYKVDGKTVEDTKWTSADTKVLVPMNNVTAVLSGDSVSDYELKVFYEGYQLVEGKDYNITIRPPADIEGNVVDASRISSIVLYECETVNPDSPYIFKGTYGTMNCKVVYPVTVTYDEEQDIAYTEIQRLIGIGYETFVNQIISDEEFRTNILKLEKHNKKQNDIEDSVIWDISDAVKAYGITEEDLSEIGASFQIDQKTQKELDAEIGSDPVLRQVVLSLDVDATADTENEKYENIVTLLLKRSYKNYTKNNSTMTTVLTMPLPKGVIADDSLSVTVAGKVCHYIYDADSKLITIGIGNSDGWSTEKIVFENRKKQPERVFVGLYYGVNTSLLEGENVDSIVATVGKAYGPLPTPMMADEEDDSVFLGWFTGASDGVQVKSDTIVSNTKNHNLYAHWQKSDNKNLEIYYDPCEGEMPDTEYPTIFQQRGVFKNLPVPVREDYEFVGWFDSVSDGVLVSNGTTVKGTGYMTLYAYWKPLSVDVAAPKAVIFGKGNEADGVYENDSISLISDTNGAVIKYTLDGTDPKAESDSVKVYTDPIVINGDLVASETNKITIRACASIRKWTSDEVVFEYNYIIPQKDPAAVGGMEKDLLDEGLTEIPEGLWVAGIPKSVEYNGANQTFDIHVYNGETRLTLNKDYVVRYYNNKNAGTARVDITGRGSFSDVYRREFTITPAVLGEEVNGEIINSPNLSIDDVTVAYNGRMQKSTTTSVYTLGNGATVRLKNGTDFAYDYVDESEGAYVKSTDSIDGESSGYRIEIVGKNNYTGRAVFYEEITERTMVKNLAIGLGNCEYDFANKGKAVYPTVSAKDKQKKLVINGFLAKGAKSDAEAMAMYEGRDESEEEYQYVYYATDNTVSGVGKVHIIGIKEQGYSGTVVKNFKIVGRTINKASYSSLLTSAYIYNGTSIDPVVEDGDNASLRFGKGGEILKGIVKSRYEELVASQDPSVSEYDYYYSYSTENRIDIGNVSTTFVGINGYSGTVIKKYKILGTSLGSRYFKPFEKVVFGFDPGRFIIPDGSQGGENAAISIRTYIRETRTYNYMPLKGIEKSEYESLSSEAKRAYDYVYEYVDFGVYGKSRVVFSGVNLYYGTKAIKIPVVPVDIKADQNQEDTELRRLEVKPVGEVEYTKGGVKPDVVIYDKVTGKQLVKDVDYRLTYSKNNQAMGIRYESKQGIVYITGRGNYSGKIETSFDIIRKPINVVSVEAGDIIYKAKAGTCKPAITVKDVNGVKLATKTDYLVDSYKYEEDTWVTQIVNKQQTGVFRAAGSVVDSQDIIPAGTVIRVTVKGFGWYTDGSTTSSCFRYVNNTVNKAVVTVTPQYFTGKAIYPGKSAITVKVGGVELAPDQYDIIGYSNNINKGNGSITIKGRGLYTGTRTATFQIKSMPISSMKTN